MRVLHLILSFIILFSFSQITYANKKILSLDDAILLALRKNPNIESSRINNLMQTYNVDVQQWEFAPQYAFQASGTYTQTNSVGEHINGTNIYNVQPTVSLLTPYGTQISLSAPYANTGTFNAGLSLQVMQPLLKGFGKPIVEAALNNAKDSADISKLNVEGVIRNTISSVINSYLDVIFAEKSIVIDQEALDRANTSVDQTKLFIKAGHKAENELTTVESNVANAKLQLLNDMNNLQQIRYALLTTIGIDPNSSVELKKTDLNDLQHKYNFTNINEIKRLTLKNDIQYQIDQITLYGPTTRSLLTANDNSRWQLNLALNASSGNGYTNDPADPQSNWVNGLFNGTNRSQSVSLTLNVPINDQTAKQAILNATLSLKQAKLALQQEKWSKEITAINAYHIATNAQQGLVYSETVENLQSQTYKMAYQKYLHGLIDGLELQSAQMQLIQGQQALLAAQMNYIKSLVNLDLLTGQTLKTWKIQTHT